MYLLQPIEFLHLGVDMTKATSGVDATNQKPFKVWTHGTVNCVISLNVLCNIPFLKNILGLVPFVQTQVGETPRIWSRHVNTYKCGLHSPSTHLRISVSHRTNFYSHWIGAELNNKAPESTENLEL